VNDLNRRRGDITGNIVPVTSEISYNGVCDGCLVHWFDFLDTLLGPYIPDT
jgi:hypothetical protein